MQPHGDVSKTLLVVVMVGASGKRRLRRLLTGSERTLIPASLGSL